MLGYLNHSALKCLQCFTFYGSVLPALVFPVLFFTRFRFVFPPFKVARVLSIVVYKSTFYQFRIPAKLIPRFAVWPFLCWIQIFISLSTFCRRHWDKVCTFRNRIPRVGDKFVLGDSGKKVRPIIILNTHFDTPVRCSCLLYTETSLKEKCGQQKNVTFLGNEDSYHQKLAAIKHCKYNENITFNTLRVLLFRNEFGLSWTDSLFHSKFEC